MNGNTEFGADHGEAVPDTTSYSGRVFVAPIRSGDSWHDLGGLDLGQLTDVADPNNIEIEWDEEVAEEIARAVRGAQFRCDGTEVSRATAFTTSAGREPGRGGERAFCPCGAEADVRYAPYCGYDCKPNFHGADTISSRDGTQMRWRPDLVSAAIDTGLTTVLVRHQRDGFWCEIFERAGAEPGTECFHVRADDGHRFVGADILVPEGDREQFDRLWPRKWKALTAELENPRNRVPVHNPWRPPSAGWIAEMVRDLYPLSPSRLDVEALRYTTSQIRNMVSPFRLALANRQVFANRSRSESETDSREETLRRVRARRNSGPQSPVRTPRRIDPHRSR